ncbi:MAG TPA: hypothetical protein VG501_09090 [Rhizomicrobium sp.]|nr:hypothetical protein [Rhizomicrobium sp.]
MDKSLIPVLLVFHDILATALLLLISLQAFIAYFPQIAARVSRPQSRLPLELRDVLCLLFVGTISLGATLYPAYRFHVRPFLEINGLQAPNGAFEIKEQLAALSILMLPAYRAAWDRRFFADTLIARRVITSLLCGAVWWNFATGHVMNSIKGLS